MISVTGRKNQNHTTSVKSGSSNDETSRKKPTVVQPATAKHGRGRGGGGPGGWDSAHQTRHDKHKDQQQGQQQGPTKHQKTRTDGPPRAQTRHRQTQEIKRTSSGGKGPSRNHTHKSTSDRAKDSNNQSTEGISTVSSNADFQDTPAQPSETEAGLDPSEGPPRTAKCDDDSSISLETNQNEDSEAPVARKAVINRIIYERVRPVLSR